MNNNTQFEYFKQLCSEKVMNSILSKAEDTMNRVQRAFGYQDLKVQFGTKMVSELRSKAIEAAAADIFSSLVGSKVKNPTTDNDPDLRFPNGYPLEIKVTANETILGGKFSKRPSPTLMVCGNGTEFFVALAGLKKSDWKPGGDSFYGTNINKRKMFDLIEEGRAVPVLGNITEILKKDGTPRNKRAFTMQKVPLR